MITLFDAFRVFIIYSLGVFVGVLLSPALYPPLLRFWYRLNEQCPECGSRNVQQPYDDRPRHLFYLCRDCDTKF